MNILIKIIIMLFILLWGFPCLANEALKRDIDKAWDHVLDASDLRKDDLFMRFLNAMKYRQFDVNEFLNDQKKYDNNLMYWLAQKNFQAGQLAEAEVCIKGALSIDSKLDNYSDAYALMGNIELLMKKNAEAAKAYECAVAAGNTSIYPSLAMSYLLMRDDASFEKVIPELMKIRGKDINALQVLIAYSGVYNKWDLFHSVINGIDDKFIAQKQDLLASIIGVLERTKNADDLARAIRLREYMIKDKISETTGIPMGSGRNGT